MGLPVIQIRSNSIVLYSEPMFSSSRRLTAMRQANMSMQQSGAYSGRLSTGAKKRLTKAINLLVQMAAPRWITNDVTGRRQYHSLSFITLTVSSSDRILTASEGYNLLLKHFLQWLRRTMNVKTYLWKAELQERGQIHYHITCPNFIHYQLIKDKWNNLQSKAGLLENYFAEHGNRMPNSTDIHAAKNVRDMASYLVKEIAKSCQNQVSTEGKIWDCSENLKKAAYFSVVCSSRHDEFIEQAIENNQAKVFAGDFFAIVQFKKLDVQKIFSQEERTRFDAHMYAIRETDPELQRLNNKRKPSTGENTLVVVRTNNFLPLPSKPEFNLFNQN